MAQCRHCGEPHLESARFCSTCGATLAPVPESEERKTVSVLFCDLVGFTASSDHADPEDVRALLRPYHAMLRTVLTRFGGTVEKFIGDAVMAVFGAPTSREDDAERAVRAGLAVLAAIRELNLTGANQLAVRIGIATGEVLVALGARPLVGEGMVFGDVVNTAARMQTVAPTGGIVIDEATYGLTQDAIDSRALQPIAVKGKTQPLSIWQVLGVHPQSESRRVDTTPFVGRSGELQALRDILNGVVRERRCRLVTIVGQPGVGKSRLVAELRNAADPDTAVLWQQGHCPAYGEAVALAAFSEIVKSTADILDTDDRDTARVKLFRAVSAVIDDVTDAGWIAGTLAALVSLVTGDKNASREETFTGWRRYLQALARQRPVVLVIEDLHWADPATLEFLDHLRLRCDDDVPLCLVATTRPELLDRIPDFGGGGSASMRLLLAALDSQHSARLISGLLGASILPPETQAMLLERTAGIPLFAEQFVRLLRDSGGIGVTRTAGTVGTTTQRLPVPDTVQALLAARLDTLNRHDKTLLQAAAVVGAALWPGAVAAVAGSGEDEVRARLDELTRREFLRRATRSSVAGQVEYRFWHELLREGAYGQIPRAVRAHLHEAVAGWWEAVAADRIAEHAEVLAYHYGVALTLASAAAGSNHAERLVLSTRRFLVLAGDRATHLDPMAAEHHYRRALELFPTPHPERPHVLRRLAWASGTVGRTDAAEAHYREAIAADLRHGNRRAAANSQAELANLLWDRGDTKSARTLVDQAFHLLRDEEPCAELAHVLGLLAFDAWTAGRAAEAVGWASRVVDVADATGLDEVRGVGLMERGQARLELDDPDGIIDIQAAVMATQAALDKGRATARGSWQLLNWHSNLVEALWLVAGTGPALVVAHRAEQLAEHRGLLHPLSAVRADGLKVLFDAGRWDELLPSAWRVTNERTGQEADYWTTIADIYIAKVLVHRGRIASAGRLVNRVCPHARAIGDLQVLGPALEVAATLSLASGDAGNALGLVRELAHATDHAPARRAWHLPALTRVCAAAGDFSLAERLLEGTDLRLRRHACAHSSAVATVAEMRGDIDAAIHRFDRAATVWRQYGHPLEQAHALLGLARCMEQRDSGRAVLAMGAAHDLLTGLGAELLEGGGLKE